MRTPEPWLSQGDLFSEVPLVIAHVNERGAVRYVEGTGPALLLTDNCILDKRTRKRQTPKVGRLHVAPVRALADLDLEEDSQRRLLAGELNPPEPIYLDLGRDGQAVALLGETYPIPSEYFGLEATKDDADAGDDYRVMIGRTDRDTRSYAMERAEQRLLQEKLAYFWSHAELTPVCTTCWNDCEEALGDWTHLDSTIADHVVTLTESRLALQRQRAADT